jgi:outer membrane protein TolC
MRGVPVTRPMTQAEVEQAARDLDSARREYELAVQDLNSLPSIATHERAALIQRKVAAWNALEAARLRYEEAQTGAAPGAGGVKF